MNVTAKRLWWLGTAAVAIAVGLQWPVRHAIALPQPVVLQKSDFMVFGGDYDAQVRNGFRPRADVSAVQLGIPLDWNMDPFGDRNWRFQLSAWRMLNPIWERWYGRDWKRLHEELAPWIHDWYRYHVTQHKVSDFEWYDMSAGLRAQHLALLLWLHNQGRLRLTPEELGEVHALAHWHIEKLRDPAFITHGNHAIFQIQGLRLLCLAWPEGGCRGEEAYSAQLMGKLLRSQFGKDGVHTENSPAYHLFVLKTFAGIRPALYPPIEHMFSHALSEARGVAPWFTLPNGEVVRMGDSAGRGVPFVRGGVPSCSSYDNLGSCIISKDIHAGGYVVVRTSPGTEPQKASMLIVGGASVAPKSHDHADELGFVLYAGGLPLLIDSGKFSYNHGRWRHYFESDIAHNVVGLEGKVLGPKDTLTDGSALREMKMRGDVYTVDGTVRRTGLVHHRRIDYQPGVSVDIADRVEARKDMRPVVYWHIDPRLSVTVNGISVSLADGNKIVAQLSLRRGNCRPEIVEGREGDTIQGWASPSYMKRQRAPVIEYHCAAGVREIHTHIKLASPMAAMPARRPHPDDLMEITGWPPRVIRWACADVVRDFPALGHGAVFGHV